MEIFHKIVDNSNSLCGTISDLARSKLNGLVQLFFVSLASDLFPLFLWLSVYFCTMLPVNDE